MTQGEKKNQKTQSQNEAKDCKNSFEWRDMKLAHSSGAGLWICSGCTGTEHIRRHSWAPAASAPSQHTLQWQQESVLAPPYHSQHRHLPYRPSGSKTTTVLITGLGDAAEGRWAGDRITRCWGIFRYKFMSAGGACQSENIPQFQHSPARAELQGAC